MSVLASAADRVPPLAPRMVIYGEGGMGKTSLAIGMPGTLLLCFEKGAEALDVDKLYPTTIQQLYDIITALVSEEHKYQAVAFDTVDWLEAMVQREICERMGWATIEAPGYGKGYKYVLENFWQELIGGIDAMAHIRGLAVMLLAHAEIVRFEDPQTGAYDRYQPKMHKSAWKLLTEAVDLVGFIGQHKTIKEQELGFGQKAQRGVALSGRELLTEPTPAAYAKRRPEFTSAKMPDAIKLPPPPALSWPAVAKFIPFYNQAAQAA